MALLMKGATSFQMAPFPTALDSWVIFMRMFKTQHHFGIIIYIGTLYSCKIRKNLPQHMKVTVATTSQQPTNRHQHL